MPYSTTWESPASVCVHFTGLVTYPEAVHAINALYDDPRCDHVERAIWDFSGIDGFSVDGEEVEEIAYTDLAASDYVRHMRAAFVIRDPALLVLAEQYVAHMARLGSPWENRIFSSLVEARRWAGPEAGA